MNKTLLLSSSLLAAGLFTVSPALAQGSMGGELGARATSFSRPEKLQEPGNIYVPGNDGNLVRYKPKPTSNVIGSTIDNGKSITVEDNGGHVHTVTTTDENGVKHIEVHRPMARGIYVLDKEGKWVPYRPKPKSKVIGSTTYEGKTIVVTDNGDGTRTVTITDPDGHVTTYQRP